YHLQDDWILEVTTYIDRAVGADIPHIYRRERFSIAPSAEHYKGEEFDETLLTAEDSLWEPGHHIVAEDLQEAIEVLQAKMEERLGEAQDKSLLLKIRKNDSA